MVKVPYYKTLTNIHHISEIKSLNSHTYTTNTQAMKRLLILLLAILPLMGWAQDKIKVACIGNSVTYGMTHKNPAETSYPTQLQQMLGEGY